MISSHLCSGRILATVVEEPVKMPEDPKPATAGPTVSTRAVYAASPRAGRTSKTIKKAMNKH
jgi:hypothetical protein